MQKNSYFCPNHNKTRPHCQIAPGLQAFGEQPSIALRKATNVASPMAPRLVLSIIFPLPSSASKYDSLLANPQAYDASSMYLPYRYLNPSNGINYSDVGVQLDKDISANFTLYDVTRRTLNCLTLLYTNAKVSLIPSAVNDFQGELVQNVIKFNQLNATINNTSQSGQTQGGSTTSDQPETPEGNEAPGNQTPTTSGGADLDPKNEAIQLLSKNAISFLDTWDTYARETLYVRGGEDAQVNEIQLVAYEAGRAMASLSWGITTTIVPIENALNHPMNTDSYHK